MLCQYLQKLCGGSGEKGEFPPGLFGEINRALDIGEEAAVAFFKSHRAEVCSHVPASQLLVFDVQEGWEPLCKFQEVPIPDGPFSNINNSNEVRLVFNTIKTVAWLAILGVSVLVFCTVLYCKDCTFLLLALGIVGLVLWGAGKIIKGAVRKQAEKSKQL